MAITVYGVAVSPFVRKVVLLLEELGMSFEHHKFTPLNKPENFTDINPVGKIPALTDGDLTLAESSVICEYLNDKYAEGRFLPSDPALKAKARWLQSYADSQLITTVTTIFFETVVKPKFLGEQADEERMNDIRENQLPPMLDFLESEAPESGYIVGDQLSLADIAIATHFINGKYAKIQVDAEKWPKLAAYLDRILSLECFKKRIADDLTMFG